MSKPTAPKATDRYKNGTLDYDHAYTPLSDLNVGLINNPNFLRITSPKGAFMLRLIYNGTDKKTGEQYSDTIYTEFPEHEWYTLNVLPRLERSTGYTSPSGYHVEKTKDADIMKRRWGEAKSSVKINKTK